MSTNQTKPRFFTGIQATGTLHLGHYLGVIRHILILQEEYEVIIMIADLHALTVPQKEMNYQEKAKEIAALLYSCGLKEDCKIFIQSQIKEHLELAWLLSPLVTVSELSKMIQYKEKKGKQETGNLALFSYPVLMAADIFLYDADLIIVGQDQQQHYELATDIFRKFNNFHQASKQGIALLKLPIFNEFSQLGSKIMGLQNPEKKMSKSGSEKDYLALLDEPKDIRDKIKKAVTDSEKKIYYDPENKDKLGTSNLLLIYALLKKLTVKEAEKEVSDLDHRRFKEKLSELVCDKLQTIQEKFSIYQAKITDLLEKNRHYCQKLAQQKMKKIKSKMKLIN
ncbi:tryptophan--tRNA ligase [endosymbiont GvMRE of Glomus versiforme]|uniref:tryptophan--tRNA ligase n=1 Tax=endosymbiont GvMRE of Glomus versiforme TaxID=2039283 RepID=UPI000EDCEF5B|nr:tryptophan--tRNA ligase [endosymbiont GvMRE of Glomus versiforme]RHZ36394.1 Tryptophan--tRNA ligase [endosymbiont GvMRE of Glomus versiforme]